MAIKAKCTPRLVASPAAHDFRDGIRFWKLTNPPKGFMRNMKAPSREAELLTRLKLFKLKYQYYIESGKVTLLCPRFTVPKIVLEDGTIADVRCVWDCTINGLNATLYAPGFMLPTALDAEDQVVKWLSVKVGEYLRLGSPVTDYSTQEASSFIRTKQGDIDVGQHFNNFRVHPQDQHCLGVRYTYTNNEEGAEEKDREYLIWTNRIFINTDQGSLEIIFGRSRALCDSCFYFVHRAYVPARGPDQDHRRILMGRPDYSLRHNQA